jgi:hypothetical protein
MGDLTAGAQRWFAYAPVVTTSSKKMGFFGGHAFTRPGGQPPQHRMPQPNPISNHRTSIAAEQRGKRKCKAKRI